MQNFNLTFNTGSWKTMPEIGISLKPLKLLKKANKQTNKQTNKNVRTIFDQVKGTRFRFQTQSEIHKR